eukprot:1965193-Prymnesium_polylepis.1
MTARARAAGWSRRTTTARPTRAARATARIVRRPRATARARLPGGAAGRTRCASGAAAVRLSAARGSPRDGRRVLR